MLIRKYIRFQKGVTLIELIVVLAITSLVIASIFPIFFFGNNTYDSGRMQFDIQSNIRLASDVIRDQVRYVSDLTVINTFDPSSADSNFNYIYLADNKKSIKFKEGSQIPVDLINSGSNDTLFELDFIKGSDNGNAIRFSNSVAAMSIVDNVLKYNILGQSALENKQYQVETEIILLNTNSQLPDVTYIEGPTAYPTEGEVPYGTTVSLTTATGATIYYTTNGDIPSTSSTEYENPISIVSDTTIKTIAVEDGVSSSLAIYNYTISLNPPPSASSITIQGVAKVGETLTVIYSYTSSGEPQIAQGGSIIKWYRATHQIGNSNHNKVLVHSAVFIEGDESTRQYKTDSEDINNYIYVEVIPIDVNGTVGLPAWTIDNFGKI